VRVERRSLGLIGRVEDAARMGLMVDYGATMGAGPE